MLNKSHITNIEIHSDQWHQGRLGRFTASEIHSIMGEKGIGDGGMKYIYRKVGEELSGMPYRDEIDTSATRHGLMHEAEAIKEIGGKMGWNFVVVQKLVAPPDSRFGCTPDFLVPVKESVDKTQWEVETGEIKCPMNYSNYVELCLAETPMDIYRISKPYFWQVIDQMNLCGALRGWLGVYQPFFKSARTNLVQFKKIDLIPQFKLLNERKTEALARFEDIRDKLLKR